MQITAIKQQVKRQGRYSIFVAGKYAFSLSDTALLDQKLVVGQELTDVEIRELKKLSDDDKIYNAALNYLAIRMRSQWEMEEYLKRKGASPALLDSILNKLSINGLLDDEKFAVAFISDRQLLRPTSRRKLIIELRKKHVDNEVIEQALMEASEEDSDVQALTDLVARKRKQTRYQDDEKLMQYLARQGFNYGDIKEALTKD